MRTSDVLAQRLRAEYLEMPGMRLTADQVQRLCGIEGRICRSVLDELVDAKFLYVDSAGQYARVSEGLLSARQSIKADPRPQRKPKAVLSSGMGRMAVR